MNMHLIHNAGDICSMLWLLECKGKRYGTHSRQYREQHAHCLKAWNDYTAIIGHAPMNGTYPLTLPTL